MRRSRVHNIILHTWLVDRDIHFVSFVEHSDHGVELALLELQLLKNVADVGSLGMELRVTQVRHIHKNILKNRR